MIWFKELIIFFVFFGYVYGVYLRILGWFCDV